MKNLTKNEVIYCSNRLLTDGKEARDNNVFIHRSIIITYDVG